MKKRKLLTALARLGIVIFLTVLIVLSAAYGMMYTLVRGPSPTARRLFVRSVRESSAAYWLADLFCTEEEIAAIESGGDEESLAETDTELVAIALKEERSQPQEDAWGLIDEDGDGLIFVDITGFGYVGKLMVVLDPSRVVMGTPTTFGVSGMTVEAMCKEYGCIAGINGGGFEDENGAGNGGTPKGLTIRDGEVCYGGMNNKSCFVGFDENDILHTGNMTGMEALAKKIQCGCSFGPVLIANGEKNNSGALASGVNPRTAIGQRSDGAVLMLVVDGRQAHSIGATYEDLADVLLTYGAVNACNLDGGSSSVLWYNGEYLNHCASMIGVRPVPTAFLVKAVDGA